MWHVACGKAEKGSGGDACASRMNIVSTIFYLQESRHAMRTNWLSSQYTVFIQLEQDITRRLKIHEHVFIISSLEEQPCVVYTTDVQLHLEVSIVEDV